MTKRSFSFKFDTRKFVASHMRAPKGRGSWAFELEQVPGCVAFSPSMTLSEAKRWAADHFAHVVPATFTGTVFVDVLP